MPSPSSEPDTEQPQIPERARLARGVVQRLLNDIRNHHFEIGSRLPAERVMAKALGVSRPIVREALVALELLGVVETRLGSGTYVTSSSTIGALTHTASSPFEMIDTLRLLEVEAIGKATKGQLVTSSLHLAERALERMASANGDFENWHEALSSFHTSLTAVSQHQMLTTLVNHLWRARCEDHAVRTLVEKSWTAGHLCPETDLAKALEAMRRFDLREARTAIETTHRETLSAIIAAHRETEMQRTDLAMRELRERFGA